MVSYHFIKFLFREELELKLLKEQQDKQLKNSIQSIL
jgi:hypothetical protein